MCTNTTKHTIGDGELVKAQSLQKLGATILGEGQQVGITQLPKDKRRNTYCKQTQKHCRLGHSNTADLHPTACHTHSPPPIAATPITLSHTYSPPPINDLFLGNGEELTSSDSLPLGRPACSRCGGVYVTENLLCEEHRFFFLVVWRKFSVEGTAHMMEQSESRTCYKYMRRHVVPFYGW